MFNNGEQMHKYNLTTSTENLNCVYTNTQLFLLSTKVRALQFWFQGAHHLAKGIGFVGDHEQLFSDIYKLADTHFDTLVERNIGMSECDSAADPYPLTCQALKYLKGMPSIAEMNSARVTAVGHGIVCEYLSCVENCYNVMKTNGQITLGIDDMLMSQANDWEIMQYKLLRRMQQEFKI